MYVIGVYDIGEKRVSKVKKVFDRYLFHIQNSVYEGDLTQSQLLSLKKDILRIINKKEDSVIIFTSNNAKWLDKEIIGVEKNKVDNFV